MRNRIKGLDLIDRVSDELWMEVCDIVQETGIKTIPKKKKFKKAKWLSGEALQIAVKRREVKSKEEKERYTHLNAGKSTGVGCHSLLQGIFPTQGSNPGLYVSGIGRRVLYLECLPGKSRYSYAFQLSTCLLSFLHRIAPAGDNKAFTHPLLDLTWRC